MLAGLLATALPKSSVSPKGPAAFETAAGHEETVAVHVVIAASRAMAGEVFAEVRAIQ